MSGLQKRVEGDNLILSVDLEKGIDSDKDGQQSVKAKGQLEFTFDGSEIVDELLKSSSMLQKIKEKLESLGLK